MVTMPPMNLDPAATPWGRAMQKELADLRATLGRAATVEVNANKAQNSSIKALSRQVTDLTATNTALTEQAAYLASLSTTTSADVDIAWTASSGGYLTAAPSITVTTTEPLIARVTYTAELSLYAEAGSSSASYTGQVMRNGADFAPALGRSNAVVNGNAGGATRLQMGFTCSRVGVVPAGTHTFTHLYSYGAVPVGGASSGARDSGMLAVEFLGRP